MVGVVSEHEWDFFLIQIIRAQDLKTSKHYRTPRSHMYPFFEPSSHAMKGIFVFSTLSDIYFRMKSLKSLSLRAAVSFDENLGIVVSVSPSKAQLNVISAVSRHL